MGCTKIIYDLLPEKLFMGYGEEQLSRTLTFDISQMQAELPGGVPMIAYMRPRDELGYLASGVTLDGSTLTWELSAHVMQYKGIGGAQIVLVDESGEETHILKSHVMQMLIGSSIPLTGGEPPEPWETWLEQILAVAARAESAAADAEAQADRAETAEAGAQQALIDAGSPVLYGREQTLTDAQQQTARGNIAAASAADVSDLKSAINTLKSNIWNAVENGCDPNLGNDCSAILNTALSIYGSGMRYYFPKGKYKFDNLIKIWGVKNIEIYGDGPAWTAYGTAFQFSGSYSFIQLSGCSAVKIHDIILYGYKDKGTNTAIAFFPQAAESYANEYRVSDTHIYNVDISGFRRGILVNAPSGYNFFNKVRIHQFPDEYSCIGFQIGDSVSNYNVDSVYPNYIYFTECSADGAGTTGANYLNTFVAYFGQFIYINRCDFCNIKNGTAVLFDNNLTRKVLQNITVTETSLFNVKNGILVRSRAASRYMREFNISNNMFVDLLDKSSDDSTTGIICDNVDSINNAIDLNVVGNLFKPNETGAFTYFSNRDCFKSDTIYKAGLYV